MKFFILLLCITLSVAYVPARHPGIVAPVPPHATPTPVSNRPSNGPSKPPQATLSQHLKDLRDLFEKEGFKDLITRYMLNDAETQGVLSVYNSYPVSLASRRFSLDPEVRTFNIWLRSHLGLSTIGSHLNIFSLGPRGFFNRNPYWASNVYGWPGLTNEFLMKFADSKIPETIRLKTQQSPLFAEFWRRWQGVGVAFSRTLLKPEVQEVILQLQEYGVDTLQLEHYIQTICGWGIPRPGGVPPPFEPTPGEPVPVEPVPVEPVPAEPEPVEPVPAEPAPIEPAEPVPAEPVPVEPVPAEPVPAEPAPAEPVPAEPSPAEPAPAEPAPAEPSPAEPAPAEPAPAEPAPVEPVPAEPVPAEPVPAEPVPAEPVPAEPVPAEPVPAEPVLAGPVPAEPESVNMIL